MGEPIDQTKDCKVKPEDKNAEQDEARKLEEVIEPIIISKDLPDEKKVEQIAHIIKVSRECFSGPMPPPKILKGYKEIIPDAPNVFYKWQRENNVTGKVQKMRCWLKIDAILKVQ